MNKVSEEADALKVTTQNTQQSTHCVPPGTPLEVHKAEDLFGEQGSRDHYLSRRIETLKNKEQPIKLSQQIYISTGTQLRTVWNTTLFNFREKRNNLWTRQALCIEHWKGLNRHWIDSRVGHPSFLPSLQTLSLISCEEPDTSEVAEMDIREIKEFVRKDKKEAIYYNKTHPKSSSRLLQKWGETEYLSLDVNDGFDSQEITFFTEVADYLNKNKPSKFG